MCIISHGARIGFAGGEMKNILMNMQTVKPSIVAMYPYLLNVLHEEVHEIIYYRTRSCKPPSIYF